MAIDEAERSRPVGSQAATSDATPVTDSSNARRATSDHRIRRVRWAISFFLTLGLAIVPPLIDPNASNIQLALIVALVGLCATLLVEQYLRSEDLSAQVRSSAESGAIVGARQTEAALSELTPIFRAPEACRVLVERIARDWQRIDQHGKVPFFGEIRASLADEMVARIAELANGSITVAVDSPYTFRESSLRGVHVHRLISVGSLDFWMDEFGRNYLEEQRKAIQERGVRIERTMVIAEEELASHMAGSTIRAHEAAGVDVAIVVRERIKPEHAAYAIDRGIVTFDNGVRMVVELNSSYAGRADRERLSTIPADLEIAETGLLVMKRYSKQPRELYGVDDEGNIVPLF